MKALNIGFLKDKLQGIIGQQTFLSIDEVNGITQEAAVIGPKSAIRHDNILPIKLFEVYMKVIKTLDEKGLVYKPCFLVMNGVLEDLSEKVETLGVYANPQVNLLAVNEENGSLDLMSTLRGANPLSQHLTFTPLVHPVLPVGHRQEMGVLVTPKRAYAVTCIFVGEGEFNVTHQPHNHDFIPAYWTPVEKLRDHLKEENACVTSLALIDHLEEFAATFEFPEIQTGLPTHY